MSAFRVTLATLWTVLAAYTTIVIWHHGIGLFPIFFGNIAALTWPGQFNLDFLCFLTLSALWTAWRADFSGIGICLALIAFVGGAGFLLPYLLWLIAREKGDIRRVVLGRKA